MENANEKEMVDAYNIADVTVVSSIEDNLPNILLESLSCGTPVVGFKIAGIKDNIVNDFNGYLADLGNIDMLSKAIKKLHTVQTYPLIVVILQLKTLVLNHMQKP